MSKINPEYIAEAKRELVDRWGDAGEAVIKAASTVIPYDGTLAEFVKWECVACGGNWGGMLLSGIKFVFPEVWDAIPDDMGCFAFSGICYTLLLCGVDTTK